MKPHLLARLLLPAKSYPTRINWVLLILRLAFGAAFFTHGLAKLSNFQTLADTFPDPLGVDSTLSLVLAVFGEAVCSVAIMVGFLHRLALLPMITTMVIAFFVIHGNDPFAAREMAFLYLIAFAGLFITGPGNISVDYQLFERR